MIVKVLAVILMLVLLVPTFTALLQEDVTPNFRQMACSESAQGIEGEPETSIVANCPTGCTAGAVWGTDLYTDDSSVCTAALHAGVISPAGGFFTLTIRDGQDEYKSSTRNDITTNPYGKWERSFSVSPSVAPDPLVLTCGMNARTLGGDLDTTYSVICPTACEPGVVWGSDIYTDDSSICTAAAHAGVLDLKAGGAVDITLLEGQESYTGTFRHNISTGSYGAWDRSYYFPAQEPPTMELSCELNAGVIPGPTGTTMVVECPANCGGRPMWGTNIYTADSSVCAAAVHAGVVTNNGGRFSVIIEDGQTSYTGSRQNLVVSADWGEYPRSFSLADEGMGDAAWLTSRPAIDEPDAEATPEATPRR